VKNGEGRQWKEEKVSVALFGTKICRFGGISLEKKSLMFAYIR
jgi:putative IMPACT (imprinted ancient) family translation regulator